MENLSLSEIEELGYYDFMAYLEVPFFNIGGAPSIDLLAEMCNIDDSSHVLDVGCGTGGNSAYIVEKYGCKVTGIDISELMIKRAIKRAKDRGLENQLSFSVANAYNLDYPDGEFDAVVTVFVSQFLDIDIAFREFLRVLKVDGFLGVNEMYRLTDVPEKLVAKVDEAEQVYRELTELPFSIRSPQEWRTGFQKTGYTDILVETFTEFLDVGRGLDMIQEMGGWWKLSSILWRTATLGLRSQKIRKRFGKMSRGKQVMLRDKETSKFFGYVVGAGRKP
jgi:ubiquinone/menaquinone biosynthesis C-methylase UbiE